MQEASALVNALKKKTHRVKLTISCLLFPSWRRRGVALTEMGVRFVW